MSAPARRVPIEPQAIDAPLTTSAIFLVLTVHDHAEAWTQVKATLGRIDDLVKNVAFRDLGASLACTVGVGSDAWGRVFGSARPAELHAFPPVTGEKHTAIATPGDLLFHIRSDRRDFCYELERQLLDALSGAVEVADETVGFRYFDTRDLLGFVDGTANPVGPSLQEASLVGDEDEAFSGGAYVVVQKYLHPLEMWAALTTEQQEAIMGRRKADNTELDDAAVGQKSHKTLATITDADGEHDILRDNMPFATPGAGQYGTYFIGYSRHLWIVERMLQRMFIGDPPGLHDRLLDFSTPVTGSTFFAPSAQLLSSLGDD